MAFSKKKILFILANLPAFFAVLLFFVSFVFYGSDWGGFINSLPTPLRIISIIVQPYFLMVFYGSKIVLNVELYSVIQKMFPNISNILYLVLLHIVAIIQVILMLVYLKSEMFKISETTKKVILYLNIFLNIVYYIFLLIGLAYGLLLYFAYFQQCAQGNCPSYID